MKDVYHLTETERGEIVRLLGDFRDLVLHLELSGFVPLGEFVIPTGSRRRASSFDIARAIASLTADA